MVYARQQPGPSLHDPANFANQLLAPACKATGLGSHSGHSMQGFTLQQRALSWVLLTLLEDLYLLRVRAYILLCPVC